MRIIYLTDIHGAFNQVAQLLSETVADAYLVAGDLIDIPFYHMDSAITYYEMQNYFTALRRTMEQEDMLLEDFVDTLMDMPQVDEDIHERGSDYQHYTIRARRVMQQKYKVLENVLSSKEQGTMVYALPGNYDMDLKFTSLHERDLHMHWRQVGDLKLAGYGGADVWTGGIPERYIVQYRAGVGVDDKKNEMFTLFKAVKPDIIMAHQPAYGFFDRLSFKGESGSPTLRTFNDNYPVKLCLSGHIHDDWGMTSHEGTVYGNPSNFGEVTVASGDVSEGGFFFRIETDGDRIEHVLLRKLVYERIYDIAEYFWKDNKWTENILDQERYNARRRHENIDMNVEKYSHIPEIELFKEIRKFFRLFQTRATEDRMEEMERVAVMLTEFFPDIAMDVVGSVNVGLSQESSDVDIVLYHRCEKECNEDPAACPSLEVVRNKMREALTGKFEFEIIDCIDLNEVERAIAAKDYESETTMRFIAYRSICRPINYKVIAPIEDELNRDVRFRKEMEGSIRSYFKIFVTTSTHIKSFDKYEARLKSIGIRIPEYIRKKIQEYLQGREL